MHIIQSKITAFFSILVVTFSVFAQDIPEPMKPRRIVNDYTGILSQQEWQALEQKLVEFNNSTSTQIAVVIVPSLNGADAASFAYEIGESWGVGQKGKDNGLVVLIKPKTQDSRGQAFIAPGYGLEGVVPDVIAKRIVEDEMIPFFKKNDYYGGIDAGVNTLISLSKGEFSPQQYANKRKQASDEGGGVFGIFIIFFLIFFFSMIGRARRARHYSLGHGVPFWVAMSMLGSSSSRNSGNWSSFSSGSGSFGGGFGGFGGGSFGGGGAGGSW